MKETTDKEALINPGDSANDFFDFEKLHPGHFNPALTATYSRTNAVWLMELCRLVYRRDQIQPSREEFLKRHELHEVKFFDRNQTQGALIKGPNFAVLVFRGTLGPKDWLSNFDAKPVKWDGEGNVHEGFDNQLSEIWSEISTQLDELKVPAFYTDHSLGAALATLASARRFLQANAASRTLHLWFTSGWHYWLHARVSAGFSALSRCQRLRHRSHCSATDTKCPIIPAQLPSRRNATSYRTRWSAP